MLKTRLIPCLIVKDGRIVQSLQFKQYLPIGKPEVAIEFFMKWDVDEIVLLDIDATRQKKAPNLALISACADRCFLPFSVGGGIASINDIRDVIKSGADKVVINYAAFKNPQFITEASDIFGRQCITVSVDYRVNNRSFPEVYLNSGRESTGMHLLQWVEQLEKLGAGEILLNAIDRDGMRQGYDIDNIRAVNDIVSIPVIACGGVGKMEDFVSGVLNGGANAVAAANIFQHSEHSTIIAKSCLKQAGVNVRLDTTVKYSTVEQLV